MLILTFYAIVDSEYILFSCKLNDNLKFEPNVLN